VSDFFSSIVLTYKGKMLLLSPDTPQISPSQYAWDLIGGRYTDTESSEQSIQRKIKHITKLDLKNIKLLASKLQNRNECIYHGELSDSDVNSMQRREGQRLEFYTLTELEKLTLSHAAAGLLAEYKEAVEELLGK